VFSLGVGIGGIPTGVLLELSPPLFSDGNPSIISPPHHGLSVLSRTICKKRNNSTPLVSKLNSNKSRDWLLKMLPLTSVLFQVKEGLRPVILSATRQWVWLYQAVDLGLSA
jgi:hypothetical protein